MSRSRRRFLPPAVTDAYKNEIARQLGVPYEVRFTGWGSIPSRECGRVGGHLGGAIVRALVRHAEEMMARGSFPQ